jgi:hypothetical protein
MHGQRRNCQQGATNLMSKDPTELLIPSEHHELLHKKIGNWKVKCHYFMAPGGEPIVAEGTDRVEALGPFWTVGHFDCVVVGKAIKGRSTTGYNPVSGNYVGTWQDSSTPFLYAFEGGFDEEGRLAMEGEGIDPSRGKLAIYRSVEELGDDERKLQLFVDQPTGAPFQVLEYFYTRVLRD